MKRSNRTDTPARRPLKTHISSALKAYSIALKAPLAAALLGLGAAQVQADTLWEIYLQSLDNDPQLAADRATYQAGLEEKNLGRSALLPQIRVNAEASSTKTNFSNIATQFFDTVEDVVINETLDLDLNGDSRVQRRSFGARLDQAIFDLPAWFDYQQGKKTSEQAAAEFSANQQEMMIRVSTAYFEVLRAHDVLEAARAEEEALLKQLEQTTQRFEVGLTAITDVYDSQAAYDSAVARRLTAQDDLLTNFDALSVLTGTPHNTVAPLEENFVVASPEPAQRSAWVDFALANNFDLKASRLAADAAGYSARSAAAEHLPTLTGTLSFDRIDNTGRRNLTTVIPDLDTTTESTNPVEDINEIKVAAITFEMPIYTGGRLSASRRQARNRAFAAEDLRTLAERDTIQNTRTLHRAVVTDVSRVGARAAAVVSAKSALEATQAGYEVGTRNIVDVLLAQRTLFQNQTEYANSLYDYILNTLNLKRAAGLLAPDDLQQLEAKLNPAKPVTRVVEPGAATAPVK